MKKSKLYTVTKGNRPAFMPGIDDNVYSIGGFVNKITDKMGNWLGGDQLMSNGKPTVAGGLLGAAGNIVGSGLNSAISGGLSSGVGEGISSIGSTIGGTLSAVNPILGGIVSAGSGLLGGITNALFGAKFNDENIADVEGNIAKMRSQNLNSVNTNAALLDAWGKVNLGYDFNKKYIGRDGLFSNKVTKKFNNLNAFQNAARAYVKHQLLTGAEQADQTQDDLAMSTFTYANGGPLIPYTGALGLMQNDAYINAINNRSDAIMGKKNILGNPQNYFGDGGGIHIAPSKKGTFTAAATKHGMGVQEFASKVLANKDDYSPAMVKKANFARNASKWHAFGGELGTNGTDWTNGLLYVDTGGTHQQNPLGGVPVGFDQNGTPNLVEEGETIWNDYVFSNRIKVPKAMFHTLGLGGAMKKGLTFADASKKLAKESEQRPNDPISLDGLNISLAKLAAVQEAERMKKEMRRNVGLESNNEIAYGGKINRFVDGGFKDWWRKYIDVHWWGHPNAKKNLDWGKIWETITGLSVDEIPIIKDIDPGVHAANVYYALSDLYDENPSLFRPYSTTEYAWIEPKSYVPFTDLSVPERSVEQQISTIDGVPLSVTGSEEKIFKWLQEQELTPDSELRKRAKDVYKKVKVQNNIGEATKWLVKNQPNLSLESRQIIANLMASNNASTMSGKFIPEDAFKALVPYYSHTESNIKKYLQKLIDNGVSFDDAFSVVRYYSSYDKNNLQSKRYNAQLEARLKNKIIAEKTNSNQSSQEKQQSPAGENINSYYVAGLSDSYKGRTGTNVIDSAINRDHSSIINSYINGQSTDEIKNKFREAFAKFTPEDWIEFDKLNDINEKGRYIKSVYDRNDESKEGNSPASGPAVTDTKTAEELAAQNNGQATEPTVPVTTKAATAKSPTTGITGLNLYDWYRNGTDGIDGGKPIGFEVSDNGRIAKDKYHKNYLDLVNNLTADDIRQWVEAHPNDPSYQSFVKAGNDINRLTTEQWRKGATDGKYGFMHHVANSILNGDYTPAPQSTNPYGIQTPDVPAQEGEVSKVPADAVNGDPRAVKDNDTDVDTQKVVENPYTPLDTRLRYAPVFGNALAVLSDLFNKPDYTYPNKLEAAAYAAGQAPTVSYQPIGDYIRYSPFDIWAAQNRLDANNRATQRAMLNQASPSRDAGLTALAYAENIGAGQLQRQAAESNLAQKQQVADFNRRTNMFNSQMGLEAAMTNARYSTQAKAQQLQGLAQAASLRDAIDRQYSAARSANLTNLFNSLGNIGRENFIFNQIGNDKSRNYIYTDPWNAGMGYRLSPAAEAEAQRRLEEEKKKATKGNVGACGGKMNKK